MKPPGKKESRRGRSRFIELTPEQLRLKTAAIRARWSPATRRKREVQKSGHWECPTVKEVH